MTVFRKLLGGTKFSGLGAEGERSRPPEDSRCQEDLCGTIDTGCQRMAVGLNTLKGFQTALKGQTEIGMIPQEFQFRSVHGRSKTTHVATVPTSLGKNGSVLKPAIFTGENSENAPFLISLPFLMSCRTVLHLDPSTGLRAHFKRFGFSVKCHIGPTGALRIPLAEFTKSQLEHVGRMNEQLMTRNSEFESTSDLSLLRDGSQARRRFFATFPTVPIERRCSRSEPTMEAMRARGVESRRTRTAAQGHGQHGPGS